MSHPSQGLFSPGERRAGTRASAHILFVATVGGRYRKSLGGTVVQSGRATEGLAYSDSGGKRRGYVLYRKD